MITLSHSSVYIIFIYTILLLPTFIVLIIANWKIFEKAGEKGWKALIPFYGKYTLFKLVWDKNVYWFSLMFELLSWTALIFFRQSAIQDRLIWLILYIIIYAVYFAFTVILQIYLAKAFGHNGKFALGLIFVHPVFICILGFGRAEYIGVQPLRANGGDKNKTHSLSALN